MSTAVIGAPEFRARSGRLVKSGPDGSLRFGLSRGYIAPDEVMDAEEFFQAQRDIELGRWRWPENPNVVAWASRRSNEKDVTVLDETTGYVGYYTRSDVEDVRTSDGVIRRAARAYFDAHPEQKLPEENGVYVPASADLGSGPLTFVLYGGSWRATPGSDDAAELASEWHTRVGLVRLGKPVDAS